MRDVSITLLSGESLCGPIWYWRPAEGWFSLVGDTPDEKIFFRDVAQAINPIAWLPGGLVGPVDLLEKARREGWDGR